MASVQLTDEELFSELKRFGYIPGPVTENTRPVYLKKLKKLREEPQHRGSRTVKAAYSRAGGPAATRPGGRDVTHLSSGRTPDRKCSVLGFSSDESDVEAPLKRKGLEHNNRAHRTSTLRPQASSEPAAQQSPLTRRQRGGRTSAPDPAPDLPTPGRVDRGPEDSRREAGKKPRSVNGVKTGKLSGEYSDSEEEEEEEEEEVRGLGGAEREIPEPRRLSAPSRGRTEPPESPAMLGAAGEGEHTEDYPSYRFPRRSIYLSLAHNHHRGARNHHVDREDGASSSSSGLFSPGLRLRFSGSRPYRGNHSNHSHSYSQALLNNKLSVPEDELLQQFRREEPASSSGFSAHYLSMFLLTAACLFFLLLGLMYLRMRGSGAPEADTVIKSHPFGSEFDSSYEKAEKDLILRLLLNLHDHLALIAGQHDCGDQQHHNRSLSIDEASAYLQAQNEEFKEFILTSLEWIIRTGQDVGIRLSGQEPGDPVTDVSEISRLESTHPKMPFTCRFRRAFFAVISKVLLIAAVVGFLCSVVCYMKYRWRREEEETRLMYDMVEKIIDVLRTNGEASQENQDQQPYLPIPHVRDSLVQPQDRKKMKRIWDRAVNFLSANESRIRTETQRIGGADFLVWRWIQPSLSGDKASAMPSKVWQGKAFPLDRRNSPPNSLTPCLKIRNMFDPVMEVGENWDLAIHEAILEKCSDNDGIIHIAVDKNSREGCVYVKCLSAEHSGKAFKSLHGSWFDGKLVTVKYLHLDRYHQRFPQALGCSTPLKASRCFLSTINSSS